MGESDSVELFKTMLKTDLYSHPLEHRGAKTMIMCCEDGCMFVRAFVRAVTKLAAVYISTMHFFPSNSLFSLFQRVTVTATRCLDSPHG